MDLEYEIKWHKKYIRDLHQHKKKPSTYHRKLTSHKIDHSRLRHFKEHVIEAIPFHKSIIEKQQKKLHAIRGLLPYRRYKKLVKISMNISGTPEYFVYDKENRDYFFVAENIKPETKKWIKKAAKLAATIILQQPDEIQHHKV
ncbi:hypothetical protein GF323_01980 [Candidatus Woesearchaeota archaeon]|nr:hypothetical protein [Candidatus Woesearchaeota archaeon]